MERIHTLYVRQYVTNENIMNYYEYKVVKVQEDVSRYLNDKVIVIGSASDSFHIGQVLELDCPVEWLEDSCDPQRRVECDIALGKRYQSIHTIKEKDFKMIDLHAQLKRLEGINI